MCALLWSFFSRVRAILKVCIKRIKSMESGKDLEVALWRDAMKLVVSPRSLKEGLSDAARLIVRHFKVDSCAIYLLDRRTEELVLQAMVGEGDTIEERLRIGQGFIGLAAYQGKSIRVAHMQCDPRLDRPPDQTPLFQSIVVVPIIDREQLLGVFGLQSKEVRQFSEEEVEILEKVVLKFVLGMMRTAQNLENMQRRTNELQALNELGQEMNSGLGLYETLELIAFG